MPSPHKPCSFVNRQPLLSICVPTYKRAAILDKSIASLVAQKEFHSPDVELVISDNASPDNTAEVVQKYAEYKNIHYHRNENNNLSRNFVTALYEGRGVFRKLCNDTLLYSEDSVRYFLDIIKENLKEKPVLFFGNRVIDTYWLKKRIDNDFDTFVESMGQPITWIGTFGTWEDDISYIDEAYGEARISRETVYFGHSEAILKLYTQKSIGVVYNDKPWCSGQYVERDYSSSQHFYEVFYTCYLKIYEPYIRQHLLSDVTFARLRKDLLFKFFIHYPIYFHVERLSGRKPFGENNLTELLQYIDNSYGNETYYYLFRLKFRFKLWNKILRFKHHLIFKIVVEMPVRLLCCLVPVKKYRKNLRTYLFRIIEEN